MSVAVIVSLPVTVAERLASFVSRLTVLGHTIVCALAAIVAKRAADKSKVFFIILIF
jgi:hypothetical protein